jgi:hypothetical protein
MQGLFITVEGIDGSGKTTVASAFAERLRQEGFAVVVTAEPGGTPLGERLRQLLLREKPLSAWAEAFLFLAARAEHVAQVIRPALRQGETEWDEGRGTRDEKRSGLWSRKPLICSCGFCILLRPTSPTNFGNGWATRGVCSRSRGRKWTKKHWCKRPSPSSCK